MNVALLDLQENLDPVEKQDFKAHPDLQDKVDLADQLVQSESQDQEVLEVLRAPVVRVANLDQLDHRDLPARLVPMESAA